MNDRAPDLRISFHGGLALLLCIAVCCLFGAQAPLRGAPEAERAPDPREGVVFDAVLQLEAPLAGTHTVLFAKYWVTPQEYRLEVLWAEPHWMAMNFAGYPVFLSIVSNCDKVHIVQPVDARQWVMEKPLPLDRPFAHKFNSYDVREIAAADFRARLWRALGRELQGNAGDFFGSREAGRGNEPLGSYEMTGNAASPERLVLKNADGTVVKDVSYVYGNGLISEETVLLPEHFIPASSQKELELSAGGVTTTHNSWPVRAHAGGRRVEVAYRPFGDASQGVSLPREISVYDASKGQLLRAAAMGDYRIMTAAERALLEKGKHAGFAWEDESESRWRSLETQYWCADHVTITAADQETLDSLEREFRGRLQQETSRVLKLRLLHMISMICILRGSDESVPDLFRAHCDLLQELNLRRTVAFSGAKLLDLLFRWRKWDLAPAVERTWTSQCTESFDAAETRDLCKEFMAKGTPLFAYILLGTLRADDQTAETRLFAETKSAEAAAALLGVACDSVAGDSPKEVLHGYYLRTIAGSEPNELLQKHLQAARRALESLDSVTAAHKPVIIDLERLEKRAEALPEAPGP